MKIRITVSVEFEGDENDLTILSLDKYVALNTIDILRKDAEIKVEKVEE